MNTRYEILDRLAVGGMAELFLARRRGEGTSGEVVALKKILPQLAEDPDFIRMFRDEAYLAATLKHPNIVRVYDVGVEGAQPFFTMEYVQGENLRAILKAALVRNQPIPLAHIVTIALGITAALHFAHEQHDAQGNPLKIVHRDVSPTNVLVAWDGTVKIVDFGIAKATAGTHITQAGMLKGKASYMSPEQCRAEPVDRRSDVFAIGILLYELITLERLFRGDSELAVLHQVLTCNVPPLSSVVPGIPANLEAIVLRALQPRPDDRYASALELQRELEAFARDHQIPVSNGGLAQYLTQQFPNRGEGKPARAPVAPPSPAPASPFSRVQVIPAGQRRLPAVAPPRRPSSPALGSPHARPTPGALTAAPHPRTSSSPPGVSARKPVTPPLRPAAGANVDHAPAPGSTPRPASPPSPPPVPASPAAASQPSSATTGAQLTQDVPRVNTVRAGTGTAVLGDASARPPAAQVRPTTESAPARTRTEPQVGEGFRASLRPDNLAQVAAPPAGQWKFTARDSKTIPAPGGPAQPRETPATSPATLHKTVGAPSQDKTMIAPADSAAIPTVDKTMVAPADSAAIPTVDKTMLAPADSAAIPTVDKTMLAPADSAAIPTVDKTMLAPALVSPASKTASENTVALKPSDEGPLPGAAAATTATTDENERDETLTPLGQTVAMRSEPAPVRVAAQSKIRRGWRPWLIWGGAAAVFAVAGLGYAHHRRSAALEGSTADVAPSATQAREWPEPVPSPAARNTPTAPEPSGGGAKQSANSEPHSGSGASADALDPTALPESGTAPAAKSPARAKGDTAVDPPPAPTAPTTVAPIPTKPPERDPPPRATSPTPADPPPQTSPSTSTPTATKPKPKRQRPPRRRPSRWPKGRLVPP